MKDEFIKKFNVVADRICSEPYRLLFPIGIWMGMVGVSPWLLYAFGLSETYSGFFHSSIQGIVFVNCFIAGFLMTFFPRFSGAPYATRFEVFGVTFLLLATAVLLKVQQWIMAEILYVFWQALLIYFVMRRVRQNKPKDPSKSPPDALLWIPVALLHGIIGTGVMIAGQLDILPAWAILTGKPMMEQGFVLCIVIGVGSFLIPRVMRTHNVPEPPGASHTCLCKSKWPTLKTANLVKLHLFNAGIMFISFYIEGAGNSPLAYALRAWAATSEYAVSGTLRWPKNTDFYVKLIYVSAWMVVAGLWLAAVFNDYRIAMLHVTFIGGFSLMVFAVGAMVIMSHAGQIGRLKAPSWPLIIILVAVVFTVMHRLMVVVYPDAYFQLLAVASLLWVLAGLSWLAFILPPIFHVPVDDEFAKMHQQDKNI